VGSTDRDGTPEDRATFRQWRERLERLGHLYRYRSLQGEEGLNRLETIVLRSQLYFVPFPQLNDPFDGRLWPTNEGTEQEKRNWWEPYVQDGSVTQAQVDHLVALPRDEDLKRIWTAHEEEVPKFGVVCFSETPHDLPMWAYYAGSHSGVCLRFRAPLLQGWTDCSPPMRVTYEDDYPVVEYYRTTRLRKGQVLVATKARAWEHEREWRMVNHAGHGLVQFDPAALDGVVLGCRIGTEEEARVRDMLARREPKVELLRAAPAERAFRLDIRPA
jgi:hypothetical protein